MPTSLMVYADVVFQSTKIAPREITETNRYRWDEAAILKGKSSLHYTGYDARKLRIIGTLYPGLGGRAPFEAMLALKTAAEMGVPKILVDFTGKSLGFYVISEIEETSKKLDKYGIPQVIDFSINLIKYENA